MRITDLTCEYLSSPLGVDAPVPRFGWRLIDPDGRRGLYQGALQVRVERAHAGERILLWDSGKVNGAHSVNVDYAGPPLDTAWDLRWRVRAWPALSGVEGDMAGQPTEWSNEARVVTGVMAPDDWKGLWIRCAQAEEHQHCWFRKSFTVASVPDLAIVYLCSIGYHELYVNGRRIGDAVLTPGVTNLQKRALYMTYDIVDALQPGENVIAVWTGPGWARADGSYGKGVWDQTPMFRCQLHMGKEPVLHSAADWRCCVSSSENIGHWKGGGQGTYGGERIDARRYQPGWNAVGFDDSEWSLSETATQSVECSSALLEPDRKVEQLNPVSIEKRDDAWRIDMGHNYTGWFEIDLEDGTAGEVVRIQTANRTEETVEYDQESEYIFDESGRGTFCHRFNWMAGRWITIQGLCRKPTPEQVRGYVVTNDRRRTGSFSCSNPLLNQIYETDLNTYIANTVNGVVMDCPHRERYGYGEVALACSWGCGLPNYTSAAFYTKCMRDWADVQDETGMINTIAPQPYPGAGGTLWSSAPITLGWEFFQAYGDKRQLEAGYPVMKRWLDYLDAAVTAGGVLMPYTIVSRFLGDWATPHGNEYGDRPEAQLFNNCVYAYDLMVFVEAAHALGYADDVETYTARLASLREHAHDYFYNPESGLYVDGLQQSMLFPLYTHITPAHLRQRVFDGFIAALEEKGYLDTGSPGLPIILKYVIEDLQCPQLLYPYLAKTSYPSYGFFLERGETAWPEYWEVDGIASRIHTCYTSIAGYFVKGIGGIRPDPRRPGMQHVLIRPCLLDDLDFAHTETESLYGRISCKWGRDGDSVIYDIEIPVNSWAEVTLPGASPDACTENGMPIRQAIGVEVAAYDETDLTLCVGAGTYSWRTSVEEPEK